MRSLSLYLSAALQCALLAVSTPTGGLHDAHVNARLRRRDLSLPLGTPPLASNRKPVAHGSLKLEDSSGYISFEVDSHMELFVAPQSSVNIDKKTLTTTLANISQLAKKRTWSNTTISSSQLPEIYHLDDDPFIWTDGTITPTGKRLAFVLSSEFGTQNLTWANVSTIAFGLGQFFTSIGSYQGAGFIVYDNDHNVTLARGSVTMLDKIPATIPSQKVPDYFTQDVNGTSLQLRFNTTGLLSGPIKPETMVEQLNDYLDVTEEWQTEYSDPQFQAANRSYWAWNVHSTRQDNSSFGLSFTPTLNQGSFRFSDLSNMIKGLQRGLVGQGYYHGASVEVFNKTANNTFALFQIQPFPIIFEDAPNIGVATAHPNISSSQGASTRD